MDTVKAEFNFLKCIEASEPTYGFVLASDSVFFLAYITETKKLTIKSVFDHSYDFTADISDLIKLSPDADLIISYEKDSFYFFIVDSACYYVLPFDDLKKRKHRQLFRRQPDFLNYFTSVAYYSTGSDPPVLIHENLLIVPYRLRTAANENLVDTYAYCLIDSFRCARPVLHRYANFPGYAYEHYDGLVNQVYFLNRKRNQFYFTNKKSDQISCYDLTSRTTSAFRIPETNHIAYGKSLDSSSIDYTREYMTRNDVNFSLFADSAGRVYLIRKRPCPENNKVYELLCFTPDGQLIDKVLIRSNHFNVPLSFMYHEQIFIPNSADHTYFTVALRL
ncbi:MAG: hypothetical protein QM743_11475 [Chitinophagaceae bacterium]